ncbi:DUF2934 domain-containing protein [Paracoccus gahaiensis]|uniref:DUF2934 domain-containing protein n=1 Tax=Paracoccus gahaiensis TaxID=1706839 RepID=A0A4U0R988_9RHOB|nr:DUF2934 domain-containing protein [Paracoccus gahaiensis]TJZ90902.1 DUF2934 domain-containing protein [Paracoccus gahaiensis]
MDKTDLIRQRAHQIWEASGHPEGMEAEHWQQAEAQLRQEGQLDAAGMPDELPDPTSPADGGASDASQADGHIIDADDGGMTDMPDEAQQAMDDPASRSRNQPG